MDSQPGLWTCASPTALRAAGTEQLAWLLAVLLSQRPVEAEPRARVVAGRTVHSPLPPPGAWRPVWPGSAWGSWDLGLVPIVGLNSESLLLSCLSASFRKLGIHSETEKTLSLCLKNAMILACKTTKPNNQKAKANPLAPAVTRGEGWTETEAFPLSGG